MNITKLLKTHSPAILSGVVIAGVISTTVLAVRVTPEANRILEEKIKEEGPVETRWEVIKAWITPTWKLYIPAAISGAATITAVILLNKVHARRTAIIAGAYSVTEKALQEYQKKVITRLGQDEHNKIQADIAQDHVNETPVSSTQIIVTGTGKTLCFDTLTSRYFEADIETIRRAVNDINEQVFNAMYSSLNDFYRRIGLPITGIGEEIGWNTDHKLDVSFSATVSEDGKPALVLDYNTSPIYGYYKGY